MSGTHIGTVTHFYDHISVAVLALTEALHVGDTVHVLGHSTDFKQEITSMQIDHREAAEAKPGDDVAVKVVQRVHPHDKIYKLEGE